MIKIDIFQQDRYVGTLRIKDRWRFLFAIDEQELRNEIETRLPTLRRSDYQIAFA